MTEELKKYLIDPDYIVTLDGHIVTKVTLADDGIDIEMLVGDIDEPYNMPFLLFPETYDGKTVVMEYYEQPVKVGVFVNHAKMLAYKKANREAIDLIRQIGWGYDGDGGVVAIIDTLEEDINKI